MVRSCPTHECKSETGLWGSGCREAAWGVGLEDTFWLRCSEWGVEIQNGSTK